MKIRELEKPDVKTSETKKRTRTFSAAAEIIISVFIGYLSADTKLGGSGIPLSVAAASLFSFIGGIASFAGTMTNLLVHGRINSSVTELIAIPALTIFGAAASSVKGDKLSPKAKGILSGTVYIICGIAAGIVFKITAGLVLALIFRGLICGTAAYFAARVISDAEKGALFSRESRPAIAVTCTLALCMLCGISFGTVNAGRTVGAFLALAAAYGYGSGAGVGAAAITVFAAGTASAALLPSSPLLVCSALTAGMFRRKGKLPAAAVFLASGLGGALVYGMTPDAMKLLADMSAAALLFCIIPDRIRGKAFMDIPAEYLERSVPIALYGEKIRFASLAVADISETFVKAVKILDGREHSCPLSETAAEHLECTEKLLSELVETSEIYPYCDEELSAVVNGIISSCGAKNSRSALFADKSGRVYIECFYEGMLNVLPDETAAKLSAAADRELAVPEAAYFGGTTRLCFHEQEIFSAEIGSAKANGREDTSGDHGTVFRDGHGGIVVILSDGMGSGIGAAVESCMTVSVAARMIKAGLGAEAAVRMANLLLMSKSAEESFSTIDMLNIDLFTGRAELIKLGAAQSFVKCGGTVKTVESRTTPVGIISSVDIDRRSFRLSDGDQVVMISDGICEEVFPEIRELMLSTGIPAQECAERIVGAAERGKDKNIFCRDDKTVYVVKLHKI